MGGAKDDDWGCLGYITESRYYRLRITKWREGTTHQHKQHREDDAVRRLLLRRHAAQERAAGRPDLVEVARVGRGEARAARHARKQRARREVAHGEEASHAAPRSKTTTAALSREAAQGVVVSRSFLLVSNCLMNF